MRGRLGIVAPLFLLSGGTALLYQVAFGKKLATIFGATAYAVSAVLAAFMAGLAIGSHLGGRYASRVKRPLVIYGWAEVVVALVCALTPQLFDAVESIYVVAATRHGDSLVLLSALRSMIAAAVVLVPTVAMGVTMPMLARAVASVGVGSKERLAALYAINTAGGAVGALLSAYVVLPTLGVYATMRSAALINLAIGGVAIIAGRTVEALPPEPAADEPAAAGTLKLRGWGSLLGLAFLSGLLVFSAEVVDTHLLALLIGNSAYAFGLMLAVFLTCLTIGAWCSNPIDQWLGAHALPFSLSLTGAALLGTLPVWGELPNVFIANADRVTSWQGRELVRGLAACAALAIPTTCMGLTFPLLLRKVAGRADVGRRVGVLMAVNTVGSIIGALLGGYWLLPALGSERSLISIGLLFSGSAIVVAWMSTERSRSLVIALVGGAIAVAALVVLPRWDMIVLTNGANVYFDERPPPDTLVFVEEDVHGGLTSVARRVI